MRSWSLNQANRDLNTGSTEWEVCDVGQAVGWLLWTSVSHGTWQRRMDSVRFCMKGEDSGWVELSFRVSAQWLVTNAQTGCGEWIPGHLFWAVHGRLGLLTPTPCAEGLGNWNFPPLSALCLSSLSQPMPGAEGCPRILGPAPNHSSWHRVQSLQANTNLKQPDVLPGTTCPYQLQAPVWRVSAEEQPRTLLFCHPRTPHPWLSVLSALTLHSPQGLDEPVLPVCSRTGLMPCGPVISPKFCLITPSAHDTRRGGLVM